MKRWLMRLALGGVVLVAVAGIVAATSPYWDGPVLLIPGGALQGPVHSGPEPDWRSVARVNTVELEVDPASPHSVRVGVLELGGHVFVPATLRPERKRWSLTLLEDPRAVLRVNQRLYPRVAERVEDRALFDALVERALAKYDAAYFDPATTWFFRLDTPTDATH